jgi:hypothetical protein
MTPAFWIGFAVGFVVAVASVAGTVLAVTRGTREELPPDYPGEDAA